MRQKLSESLRNIKLKCHSITKATFLADRTNGRAYATVCRRRRLSSSVTLCIVAKRCVLEQKLLLRAYGKSYMRNPEIFARIGAGC